MREIFITVPSPHPTGPIKGAYALANALAEERPVTLVTLKHGPGAGTMLDPRVKERSLADLGRGWRNRLHAYRAMLRDAGGKRHVASISMCLTADMVNCLSGSAAVTCASIRGNLLSNYRLDYGLPGVPVAVAHLTALRWADHIVAITSSMAAQVRAYTGKTPTIIGNFVDEAALDPFRASGPATGPYRLVFLASLTERKQPLLAIQAVHELRRLGFDVVLDVIGAGPLGSAVAAEATRLGIRDSITLHGHLTTPYAVLANADVMLLPSLSEGMPRAALEALHLGVPCVLRAVDGNAELITAPEHGELFQHDRALADVVLTVAQRSRSLPRTRDSLLPPQFRQREQARRYLALVEQE
jgi:hypothetical protein